MESQGNPQFPRKVVALSLGIVGAFVLLVFGLKWIAAGHPDRLGFELEFHYATIPWINISLSPWLLIPGLLLCGVLVAYLYYIQQRIASQRIIYALTAIRIALIILVFVLLISPALRWTRTGSSEGTLFVLADESLSMDRVDKQSSPVERLRWADALGYLPEGARPGKLDRHVAAVSALRDEWTYQTARGELSTEETDAKKQEAEVEELAKTLAKWAGTLEDVATKIEADATVKASGDPAAAAKPLRDAAAETRAAADKAEDKAKLEEASREIPWQPVREKLDAVLTALRPLADQADQNLLNEKAGDQAFQSALDKVGGMKRAELALAVLTEKSHNSGVGLVQVFPRQRTKVLAFADDSQLIEPSDPAQLSNYLKNSLAPAGFATNMAGPLRKVNDQINSGQPASVIVVADGRVNAGGDLVEASRLLAARGVRVHTLFVGTRQIVPDATIDQVDAPDWVFKNDTVTVDAWLRLDGMAGKPVKVEFRRGEQVIGEPKTITPSSDRATERVRFTDKPPESGVFEYEVRISEAPDEATADNNRQTMRVSVKEDKLSVLVIDDQPRWEYRYLINYLGRDRRVKLQTVLLSPARVTDIERKDPPKMASPDNESTEAQLLPDKKEGWAAFDLIVLGDVPATMLSEANQEMLTAAVKDRGATLLVIAGPNAMPHAYGNTKIKDLLPVELESNPWSDDDLNRHLVKGFTPVVAPEGENSILSQFAAEEGFNAQLWSTLPASYWHSAKTQSKRGANVIWAIEERVEPGAAAAAPAPAATKPGDEIGLTLDEARKKTLLSTMSVGLGRVMYLSSDQTWRLRQVNGENLHERLWGQVIRWVVGHDLPAGGKLVKFGTNKPRYVAGESVLITARLLGKDLAPLTGKTVKAVARVAAEKDPKTGQAKSSGKGKKLAEVTLVESGEAPGYYKGSFDRLPPGPIELALDGDEVEALYKDDKAVTSKTLAVDVHTKMNVEQQNVNADPAALAEVARAGGGIALDGAYYDVLAGHMPELDYVVPQAVEVGLFGNARDFYTRFAHWAFLVMFVGLITAEWIIRKVGGLV